MKNDSFLFPFGMPGDSLFDSDNDGKLTGLETAFRDACIMTAIDYLLGDEKQAENDFDEDEEFDLFDDS